MAQSYRSQGTLIGGKGMENSPPRAIFAGQFSGISPSFRKGSANGSLVAMVHRSRRSSGNLVYAAAGYVLWNRLSSGLIARVGEDYPQEWLETYQRGVDIRGVRVLPEAMICALLRVYQLDHAGDRRPVSYLRLDPFPKPCLGSADRRHSHGQPYR